MATFALSKYRNNQISLQKPSSQFFAGGSFVYLSSTLLRIHVAISCILWRLPLPSPKRPRIDRGLKNMHLSIHQSTIFHPLIYNPSIHQPAQHCSTLSFIHQSDPLPFPLSRSSLPQRGSTLSGSEAPSWPPCPPSSRCGSASRSTMKQAQALSTASASRKLRPLPSPPLFFRPD